MITKSSEPGVWSIHDVKQPPVEGIAVYEYRRYWLCERDGTFRKFKPNTRLYCQHITDIQSIIEETSSKENLDDNQENTSEGILPSQEDRR